MSRWEPGGIGFELEKREPVDPGARLKRFTQDNMTLKRALELADACGPLGRVYLWGIVQKLKAQG